MGVITLFFYKSVLLITIHYTLHCYMNYQLFCDFSISRLYFSIKNEKKKRKEKVQAEEGDGRTSLMDMGQVKSISVFYNILGAYVSYRVS